MQRMIAEKHVSNASEAKNIRLQSDADAFAHRLPVYNAAGSRFVNSQAVVDGLPLLDSTLPHIQQLIQRHFFDRVRPSTVVGVLWA